MRHVQQEWSEEHEWVKQRYILYMSKWGENGSLLQTSQLYIQHLMLSFRWFKKWYSQLTCLNKC